MKTSHDLNFNATECLKTTADYGLTKVTNICTGTVTEVPWGSADWAIAIGLTFLGFGLLLMLLAFGAFMMREFIRG